MLRNTNPVVASLTLKVYLDAVGRAHEKRLWGFLGVLGTTEDRSLSTVVSALKHNHPGGLESSGELKGKNLPDTAIETAWKAIQGHPIYFFPRFYPEVGSKEVVAFGEDLDNFLGSLEPNSSRSDGPAIEGFLDRLRKYFQSLKDTNRHKFICEFMHPWIVIQALGKLGIIQQLLAAKFYYDTENFPNPPECAWGLKAFLAAALQAEGMAPKFSGNSLWETPSEGSIQVNAACDSKSYPGLELVDVLLHGCVRDLKSFDVCKKVIAKYEAGFSKPLTKPPT